MAAFFTELLLITCPMLLLTCHADEPFVAKTKRPELVIAIDDEAVLKPSKMAPPDFYYHRSHKVAHRSKPQRATVVVFTSKSEFYQNLLGNQTDFGVRNWAFDQITARRRSSEIISKSAATSSARNLTIPLRFRFVDTLSWSSRRNGLSLMNEIADILVNDEVIGVITETIPDPEPETIWTQVVYETAVSLKLPFVVADIRGPTFTPSLVSGDTGTDEEDDGQAAGDCIDRETTIGDESAMGNILSAMPSQQELDAGILEVIFAAVRATPFAIVVIEQEDINQGAALSSTVEELLNAATKREQVAQLIRLKGHVIDKGADSARNWQRAVREVSQRWRKFVIVSYKPEFEHKFINTALSLGLAGRGYMYLMLNFDFHLNPLSVSCFIGDQTSINSIRLRRLHPTWSYDDDSDEDKMWYVNNKAVEEVDFDAVAMTTAIRTFRRSLNLSSNQQDEQQGDEKKCSKYRTQQMPRFLTKTFQEERPGWVLELLNMTNDGYFVRLQYIFSLGKTVWILNPVVSVSASLLNNATVVAGKQQQLQRRLRRRTEPIGISGRQNINALPPCQNNRRLKITMILESPFIMQKKPRAPATNYSSLLAVPALRQVANKIAATSEQDDAASANNDAGYEGYCIDLVEMLSLDLGFSYELYVVPDGKYGSMGEDGRWNGMIGELVNGGADVALAPLTITKRRANVVDFTQSFMTLGIGLLYYRPDIIGRSGMFSFFRPFKWEVWLTAALSVFAYGVMHFLLSYLSPVERNAPMTWAEAFHPPKPPATSIPSPLWTLPNSIWLAVSTILQQGCDFFPTSRSTKFLYITWGFVSLALCSCYTANLAAFLTTERLETPIRKAADLLAQNKTKYGTLLGGSTHSFFKNSKVDAFRELYASMVRDQTFVESQHEGVRRITATKGKFAFFLESTKLEYEVARDCKLVQVGPLLDSKGYGLATQKGSPLRDMLTISILKLQTEGILQELKNKWWFEQRRSINNINDDCSESSLEMASSVARRSTSKLSMDILGGAFMVLFGGVAIGLTASIVEFIIFGISKAVRKERVRFNFETMLNAWRFHLKRVVAAGASRVVLPIVDREIY